MGDLTSDNGRFYAVQQGDGNFVVYDRLDPNNWRAVWDMWTELKKNPQEDFQPLPDNPSIPSPNIPSNPSPIISGNNDPVLIRRNVNPIGMAYWRNINQHRGHDTFDVVLSDPNSYLVLLTIAKNSLQILNERQLGVLHTGEGLHFSALDPYRLFIPYGRKLVKFNTISLQEEEIVWAPDEGENLWQCHVNYAENVFSASIQNSNYNIVKWGVNYKGNVKYFPVNGEPDECQVDKGGEWLLVKEDANNRIIHINSGREIFISNEQGALGHSDCGFECALGENDYSNFGGALDCIDFTTHDLQSNIYHTDIWNMGYFSFTNAKPGNRFEQYGVLSSSDNRLIQVKLNGEARTICDLLTQSQEYENRPKANLCPEGEFVVWTALVNGQLNAYVVKVPRF